MTPPSPLPSTILLDLDGTLVDANEAIVDGVLELAAERGLRVPDRAWTRSRIGHEPESTWVALGAEDPAAMVAAFSAKVLPTLAERTHVLPGVADALGRLAAEGFVLAVATTRLTESAEHTLEFTGLSVHITHVTGRDRVERAKPAPDVVLHALQAVRAEATAAIMVGDSDADVLAARAAGVPAWAVLGGVGEEKALRDAGADFILARGVGELPDHLMR
jgi:HAD superfamily hydrolase (TIGR01509 family)